MKQESTLNDVLRQGLEHNNAPYSEALWQKLDEQLVPVRQAYHKKEKRRVAAYWTIAAALLLGGGITYFASQKNNTTAKTIGTEKTQQVGANEAPHSCCKKTTEETTAENVATTNAENINAINNNDVAVNTNVENNNKSIKSYETKTANAISNITTNNNNVAKQRITKTTKAKKIKTSNLNSENVTPVLIAKNDNEDNTIEKITIAPALKSEDNNDQNVTTPDVNNGIIKTDAVTPPLPVVDVKPATALTPAKKVIPTKQPMQLYILGGVNMTNSFSKSGYVGGVMLEKQIKEKRIFAGVKVAFNKLEHQLIASKNASTTPQMTDAIINKMTTIQMPFGYQFELRKKITNPTYLNVGFEPTLLTGIQTIYYDDNGVPGGPRTPVTNSPLLHNAINHFNVSFNLGLKKQITNKVGATLNSGYGLINITDKQYYNKSGGNNNLKYVQVGLLYRL
jgi:hypothetical protein